MEAQRATVEQPRLNGRYDDRLTPEQVKSRSATVLRPSLFGPAPTLTLPAGLSEGTPGESAVGGSSAGLDLLQTPAWCRARR
jgi:hypothetical protein